MRSSKGSKRIIEKLVPNPEVRGLDPRVRIGEINHSCFGCAFQNTDRAGEWEVSSPCGGSTFLFIDQQESGAQFTGEAYRGALAFVQIGEVFDLLWSLNPEPGRFETSEVLNGWRPSRSAKFVHHLRRHEDFSEESG
jgi:hypothetical protein